MEAYNKTQVSIKQAESLERSIEAVNHILIQKVAQEVTIVTAAEISNITGDSTQPIGLFMTHIKSAFEAKGWKVNYCGIGYFEFR